MKKRWAGPRLKHFSYEVTGRRPRSDSKERQKLGMSLLFLKFRCIIGL